VKVAILGNGFVGNATRYFLENCTNQELEILIEDPAQGKHIDDWNDVEYTFICVPTDNFNGQLNLTNVLQAMRRAAGIPVIRSTVGPDQITLIAMGSNKEFIMWPEFLREATWKEDTLDATIPMLLGGNEDAVHKLRKHCFSSVDRKIITVGHKEASMAKMSRNAMLAAKVAQANHLYDLCNKYDIDYEKVKEFIIEDGTLGKTHFEIQHLGSRGFGGKCLPKDTKHYESMFSEDSMYTLLLEYNETL